MTPRPPASPDATQDPSGHAAALAAEAARATALVQERMLRMRDESARLREIVRAELDGELQAARERIAALQDAATQARAEADLACADAGRARGEVEALRTSRSWRLTAPIRAVTGRLGRGG